MKSAQKVEGCPVHGHGAAMASEAGTPKAARNASAVFPRAVTAGRDGGADGRSRTIGEGGSEPSSPAKDSNRGRLRPTEAIPGPPSARLVGWPGNAMRFFRNPLAYMLDLARDYGPLARLAQGGNRPLLVSTDNREASTFFVLGSEPARELLSDIGRFPSQAPPGPRTHAGDRIGTNILFTNGERHRHLRNLFRPAFERRQLEGYYGHMARLTSDMLDRWKERETVDLAAELTELTLRIGSRCLFGIEVENQERSLAHAMGEMLLALYSPVSKVPINIPGSPYRRMLNLIDEIDAGLDAEAEKKRSEDYVGDDLMSLMVRMHDENPDQLTGDELIGNAFTMYFAGHDTASKGLVWILYLLCQHPEVAAQLYEEIDRETGGEAPAYDRLFRLPVLDRVVKEGLRVLSPAAMFVRYAAEDTSLMGYRVPRGSEVIYSPHVINKDPAVFGRPKKFLPDRWLGIKPSRFEYLPFGAGPRVCVGASFGNIQFRVVLAMLIHRYRLGIEPGTRIDLKTVGVIGPKGPLPVRVHAQDRDFSASPAPVAGFINELVELDPEVTGG